MLWYVNVFRMAGGRKMTIEKQALILCSAAYLHSHPLLYNHVRERMFPACHRQIRAERAGVLLAPCYRATTPSSAET